MEQQSFSHRFNSKLSLFPTQTSSQIPKRIKPLLLTHSKGNHIGGFHFQKSQKLYPKAFRQARYIVNQKEKAYKRSKAFTKILKSQNKLSNLHYSLVLSRHFENILLFSNKKNLSTARYLNVTLSNLHGASIESVKTIWKSMSYLKNLITLEMDLQYLKLQDPKILPKLFKSIRKIRSLTSFSFTLFNCKEVSQAHFDSFCDHLSKLVQLQTLKLNLDDSINPGSQNIFHNLALALPKLTLLTQLAISLRGFKEVSISNISELLQSLRFLKALSDLKINLNSFQILPKPKKPLPTIFACLALPSLQKLMFYLPRNINDKCLEKLSKVLMNLISLKTLNLHLIPCLNITDQGIDHLNLALSRMLTLSSLTLHLPFTSKTPLIIEKVAPALKPLQNLVKLNLMFKISLTDTLKQPARSEDIQQLLTNLRFLKSLQYLDLALPTRNDLKDKAFEALAESLKELASLKSIFFNPGFTERLTNKGVEALSDAIKSLKNLSELTLFFRSNKNLDQKALNFLGNAFLSHPSLNSIKLTFAECLQVEKLKSFGTLFQAIKQMKDTNDVVLNIPELENSGPEVEYLKEKNILQTSQDA